MKDSEKMRPLINASIDNLFAVITGKKDLTEETKMSLKLIPSFAKILQSENAKASIGFRVYKDFYAEDKEAFKEAILTMQPDILPVQPKQLTVRKNK